jgi:hypothetical protein
MLLERCGVVLSIGYADWGKMPTCIQVKYAKRNKEKGEAHVDEMFKGVDATHL